MGMYDNVNYEAPCPKCGTVLKDWQSKNGPCLLGTLEPYEVDNFYTSCDNCKAWVDVQVERDLTVLVNKVVLHPSYSETYSGPSTFVEATDLTGKYRCERGRIVNPGP